MAWEEYYSGLAEDYYENQNQLNELLELKDDELKSLIHRYGFYNSNYTELVKNICNNENKLSKKQRWCLAKYIIDNIELENLCE